MALTDINFQEGEGQDFINEIPSTIYTGSLSDINIETNSSQYFVSEIPEVTSSSGGNIFIMSE
ncbi:MAG: hypothetical protein RLZZ517_589 [Candidatus Parcubacteria bacterium]|jgi:hypothetical protein